MTEYRKRKRYRPRIRAPYRASAADLYRRMLNRYRSIRPTRGGGGGHSRRPNRPILEKYHPTTPEYKPKTRDTTSSQLRRESHTHVETPAYRPEPDIDSLLTELEKRFDQRLHQRVLEMMEKEFDESRTDLFNRYNLPETSPDKELQEKIQQLTGQERWQEQTEESSVETREEKARYTNEVSDRNQDEHLTENTNASESMPESASEIVDEANIETQESISVTEPGLAEPLELPDSNHTSIEHPQEATVSPDQATEPIEGSLLDNPLLIADIEALYNELELDELEPQEEQLEPES